MVLRTPDRVWLAFYGVLANLRFTELGFCKISIKTKEPLQVQRLFCLKLPKRRFLLNCQVTSYFATSSLCAVDIDIISTSH